MMAEEDVICLVYTLDIYGSHPVPLTPKIELLASPIQMSQKDINDILMTIAATPSAPLIGGYGQPELTS